MLNSYDLFVRICCFSGGWGCGVVCFVSFFAFLSALHALTFGDGHAGMCYPADYLQCLFLTLKKNLSHCTKMHWFSFLNDLLTIPRLMLAAAASQRSSLISFSFCHCINTYLDAQQWLTAKASSPNALEQRKAHGMLWLLCDNAYSLIGRKHLKHFVNLSCFNVYHEKKAISLQWKCKYSSWRVKAAIWKNISLCCPFWINIRKMLFEQSLFQRYQKWSRILPGLAKRYDGTMSYTLDRTAVCIFFFKAV